MKFQFNVNISEQDYLDYNIFWMMKSPYGKKQILTFRIQIIVILSMLALITLFNYGLSTESFIKIILIIILLLIAQISLKGFITLSLKNMIKSLKKKGKMGYSPSSIIEFYEDKFIEITEENRVEQKYSVVERISVVDNKMIYIHVNNIMSYILPLSCFESKEQYDNFFEFIKTKCINIDIY